MMLRYVTLRSTRIFFMLETRIEMTNGIFCFYIVVHFMIMIMIVFVSLIRKCFQFNHYNILL